MNRFGCFRGAVLGLMACVCMDLPREIQAADAGPIRAMTFNLRTSRAPDGVDAWSQRKDFVVEVMRRFDGDFVGAQEAQPDQVAYLREQLPQYRLLVRSREVDPNKGEAVPLLYRHERWQLDARAQGTFWLSESPEVPGSRAWGAQLPRIATWGRFLEKSSGRAVYVYCTHLDHQSTQARAQGSALLVRRIAARPHPDPVIVLGDFNCDAASEPLRRLTGEVADSPLRLVDTFRAVRKETAGTGTFHGFTGAREGAKIDFVLASRPVQVREAQIVYDQKDGRYPSDHFPVTAVLEFPLPKAR